MFLNKHKSKLKENTASFAFFARDQVRFEDMKNNNTDAKISMTKWSKKYGNFNDPTFLRSPHCIHEKDSTERTLDAQRHPCGIISFYQRAILITLEKMNASQEVRSSVRTVDSS